MMARYDCYKIPADLAKRGRKRETKVKKGCFLFLLSLICPGFYMKSLVWVSAVVPSVFYASFGIPLAIFLSEWEKILGEGLAYSTAQYSTGFHNRGQKYLWIWIGRPVKSISCKLLSLRNRAALSFFVTTAKLSTRLIIPKCLQFPSTSLQYLPETQTNRIQTQSSAALYVCAKPSWELLTVGAVDSVNHCRVNEDSRLLRRIKLVLKVASASAAVQYQQCDWKASASCSISCARTITWLCSRGRNVLCACLPWQQSC